MLAIVGATGKIGGATLSSLLSEKIIPANQILATTISSSSSPKWSSIAEKSVQVRYATFEDPSSMNEAFRGCDRLFLVSSPRIALDYMDAPPGAGREKDHFVALEAAEKAGVNHIFYTSLAFANASKSNVMTAHERTEERLREMEKHGMKVTIIREAGDGKISWTAIADLGRATALIIGAEGDEYVGKTVYLSNSKAPKSLEEIAKVVSEAKGKDVVLRVGSREEHEKFYIEDRQMDEGHIKWWSHTYAALEDGECEIKEGKTLEKLLGSKGRTPKPVEETIREMLAVK
ncbi:NAD(P)-binding protein [Tothia fuscella]|uniref:NAD(P)-binding protein n=1 Tax=Tothia fuscella TaxID=1048955 RepID=A0A9P4TU94_9PEZI|nr:NAD(P)-binding protein [Tothia fuscella]